MPPLTLLKVNPESTLEFPVGNAVAKLTITNVSATLVAYKVKSTAAKSYVIKPSSGQVRKGENAEVQILRKEDEPAASEKKPDRFLVQAAAVDTDEKKLLLHAANQKGSQGKAVGPAKFWDGVSKDALEEKQLQAVIVTPNAATDEFMDCEEEPSADVAPVAASAPSQGKKQVAKGAHKGGNKAPAPAGTLGMPANEDVDAILGKYTLPGRSTGSVPQPQGGAGAPPGFGGPSNGTQQGSGDVVGSGGVVESTPDAVSASPPLPLKRAPIRRREDVVLQKHQRPVTCVALSQSGSELFTCGKDKLVFSWGCPGGENLALFEGHRGAVWACSVSSDGELLLTCGADNAVLLWEVASAKKLAEVQLPGVARYVEWRPDVFTHSFSQQKTRPFAACSNSFAKRPASLFVLDFPVNCAAVAAQQGSVDYRWCNTIAEPQLPSSATQVSWIGNRICSVHPSGEIMLWRLAGFEDSTPPGELLWKLQAHKGACSMAAFPADRQLMATCGRADMEVKLWSLRNEGEPTLLRSFQCDRPLNAVALRPTLTHEDAFNPAGSSLCDCLVGGGQDARDVALVGAGADDQFDPLPLKMTGSDKFDLYVPPGVEDRAGRGHFGPIHALTFSVDGSFCISGSEDGNVRIRELIDHESAAAANSSYEAPGGQRVAAGSAARPTPKQAASSAKAKSQPDAHAKAKQAAQSQKHAWQGPPAGSATSVRLVALYDFDPRSANWPPKAQALPLSLQRGMEIVLTQDLQNGWAWGQSVPDPQLVGLFPVQYTCTLTQYQERARMAYENAMRAQQQEMLRNSGAPEQQIPYSAAEKQHQIATATAAQAAATQQLAQQLQLGGAGSLSQAQQLQLQQMQSQAAAQQWHMQQMQAQAAQAQRGQDAGPLSAAAPSNGGGVAAPGTRGLPAAPPPGPGPGLGQGLAAPAPGNAEKVLDGEDEEEGDCSQS